MGCFSVCFGIPKNQKAPKKALDSSFPRDQKVESERCKMGTLQPATPVEASISVASDPPTLESKDKYDDPLNCPRVKVTVDSYEEASIQQVSKFPVENDKKEKEIERETKANIGDQDIANCPDKILEQEEKNIQIQSFSDSSSSSSMISYPPMNKYNNCCSSSENESEAIKLQRIEENGYVFVQEESSESLFSLSIESRKQEENATEMDDKEVNSPITTGLNQNQNVRYGNCVLNPVENLSRWKKKEVASTTIGMSVTLEINEDDEKENVNLGQGGGIIIIPFSEEPSFNKHLNPNSKQDLKAEDSEFAAVDTSLSSWLVEPPPMIKESPNSSSKFEDRPILGALTIDEIKEHPVSSSTPRRSPGRYSQQDEMPIIGTVGSYWSHTGQKN